MDKATLQQLFHRQANANKYDFGHVLVFGGAEGTVGAPLLSAKAALRSGAGLVTIAAPAKVTEKLERHVEEMMTLSLPQSNTAATETLLDFINKRHVNAIIVGPGLSADSASVCRDFLSKTKQPIVLDAGGLTAFKNHLDKLKTISSRAPVIITPHTSEYQKFTSTDLPDDESLVEKEVSDMAKKLNITIVLKGRRTLVAHPYGQTGRNTTSNPGMATAGSGDVLAGVIAGLLAQKIPAGQASVAGVYLHGLAGDIARNEKTEPGMVASDIIENLPNALKQLAKEKGVAP